MDPAEKARVAEASGPGPSRRRASILLLLGVAVGGGLFLFGSCGAIAAVHTSRSDFCNSCHFMEPYYRSWQVSPHGDVECVRCHIPSGAGPLAMAKLRGLGQLFTYVSRAEGPKPRAQIPDESCVGCHDPAKLKDRVEFRGVSFSHGAHRGDLGGGKTLQCTTCHNQSDREVHIGVDSPSCILCHMKRGGDLGKCDVCHAVPEETFILRGVEFDHAQVGALGMPCGKCHAPAQPDHGRVPRERCAVCHDRADALEALGLVEAVHRAHVPQRRADCFDCHLAFPHGRPDPHPLAEDCRGCHEAGHVAQLQLYSGTGGIGVEREPSPMFLSRADCQACHIVHSRTRAGLSVWTGGEEGCASCHGPRIGKILRESKEVIDKLLVEATAELASLEALLAAAGDPSDEDRRRVADARHNIDLVRVGRGVHNILYSDALLEAALEMLREVREGLPE